MCELCNDLWTMGYRAPELNIRCDRNPRHAGKHMNREHKLEWWGKGTMIDTITELLA